MHDQDPDAMSECWRRIVAEIGAVPDGITVPATPWLPFVR